MNNIRKWYNGEDEFLIFSNDFCKNQDFNNPHLIYLSECFEELKEQYKAHSKGLSENSQLISDFLENIRYLYISSDYAHEEAINRKDEDNVIIQSINNIVSFYIMMEKLAVNYFNNTKYIKIVKKANYCIDICFKNPEGNYLLIDAFNNANGSTVQKKCINYCKKHRGMDGYEGVYRLQTDDEANLRLIPIIRDLYDMIQLDYSLLCSIGGSIPFGDTLFLFMALYEEEIDPIIDIFIPNACSVTLQTEPARVLPKDLDTKEAHSIFQKAVENGLIEQNGIGYSWIGGTGELLAYFVVKCSQKLKLGYGKLDKKGEQTVRWRPFNVMFNEKDIKSYKYNYMKSETIFKPKRHEIVDLLF